MHGGKDASSEAYSALIRPGHPPHAILQLGLSWTALHGVGRRFDVRVGLQPPTCALCRNMPLITRRAQSPYSGTSATRVIDRICVGTIGSEPGRLAFASDPVGLPLSGANVNTEGSSTNGGIAR